MMLLVGGRCLAKKMEDGGDDGVCGASAECEKDERYSREESKNLSFELSAWCYLPTYVVLFSMSDESGRTTLYVSGIRIDNR